MLRHHFHDPLLMARRAGADLRAGERGRAEGRYATCMSCRALADDLVRLPAMLAQLPAPRPSWRDFRLGPEVLWRPAPRAKTWNRPAVGRLAPALAVIGLCAILIGSPGLLGLWSNTALTGGAMTSAPEVQAGPTDTAATLEAKGSRSPNPVPAASSFAGFSQLSTPPADSGVGLTATSILVSAPNSTWQISRLLLGVGVFLLASGLLLGWRRRQRLG
jgi:hypothetical protein